MKKQFKILSILSVMVLVLMFGINVKAEVKQSQNEFTAVAFSSTAYWNGNDTYKEDDSGYLWVYDENSSLYNDIQEYASSISKNFIKASLLSYSLWYSFCNGAAVCTAAPEWLNSSTYWLGNSPSPNGSNMLYVKDYANGTSAAFGSAPINGNVVGRGSIIGIRPVITIATSDIEI